MKVSILLFPLLFLHSPCVFSTETIISRAQLLATIPSWGPEFTLSLELFINSFPDAATNYAEVIRFTKSAVDCCDYGTRIPAIFIKVGDILEVSPPGGASGQINVHINTWYKINLIQYFHKYSNKVSIELVLTYSFAMFIFSISLKSRLIMFYWLSIHGIM